MATQCEAGHTVFVGHLRNIHMFVFGGICQVFLNHKNQTSPCQAVKVQNIRVRANID